MMRLPFGEIVRVLEEKLLKYQCPAAQAHEVAYAMGENALEGTYSHGVNRFAALIRSIERGETRVGTRPQLICSFGALENYDGQRGLGITNGLFAVDRAVLLARRHGTGCVALRNTSHWLRAATYAYRACRAGMASICFTNTLPNMPTWGAKGARLGNNPIVFGFPRAKGDLIADMAMSQFAYGALEVAVLEGRKMPVDAGWDKEGNLTRDPQAVMDSGRILPTGYWKGAALAQLLDIFAGVVSLGNTTAAISKLGGNIDVSQMFIAVNYRAVAPQELSEPLIEQSVEYLLNSEKAGEKEKIIFTGQLAIEARRDNLANGIPVHEEVWKEVLAL
jgi:3-dehydro-L-gulonate 2-dehydrogenase